MELIKNYGLFWRRELIPAQSSKGKTDLEIQEWPRKGALLGVGVRQKRQGVVDFAKQRGIYALYDDQFRLVYVGQAGSQKGRLYRRLRNHTVNVLSERWSRFSWFGITGVTDAAGNGQLLLEEEVEEDNISTKRSVVLDHIEAVLISAGEPFRNKQGGRFGKEVTHYRQFKGDFDVNETFDAGGDFEA